MLFKILQYSGKLYNKIIRLLYCKHELRIRCKMSVTLNTDLGNIKIELFCELVPKAATNFLALAASGYYNGSLFHRY